MWWLPEWEIMIIITRRKEEKGVGSLNKFLTH
jgi:hypothetical protein